MPQKYFMKAFYCLRALKKQRKTKLSQDNSKINLKTVQTLKAAIALSQSARKAEKNTF